MSEAKNIPHPPRFPFIGNVPQIFGDAFVQNLLKLGERYGPFFEMVIPGSHFYVATSHEIVREICDDQRFHKAVGGVLEQIRRFAGDGLFTAMGTEPNWSKAHNILIQGFGIKQMRAYLPQMHHVALQLVQHWQKNQGQPIDVSEDFTKLTLETIALCGFDYSFNSFASEHRHPFLDAMVGGLKDSFSRVKKTKLQRAFDRKSDIQFLAHKELMFKVVDDVIYNRLQQPDHTKTARTDFLSLMLDGVDRATGEKLDTVNIRYQLLTFLIAGHETTSGLLSFATYFLSQNPQILARCRDEADRIFSTDKIPEIKDVNELRFIHQVLKESLRLWPTAPVFSRTPMEDTQLGGRFSMKKGERVLVLVPALHRDLAVWGQNSDLFDPDRFLPDRESQLPEYAYRPFGTGERACIGQHFAMVEASLALGMILYHFDIKTDPQYQLQIKETLTLKPEGFRISVAARYRSHAISQSKTSNGSARILPLGTPRPRDGAISPVQAVPDHGTPLAIYYGSNMGTCEDFAMALAEHSQRLGFMSKVATLDSAVDSLPNTGAIVIITSTYNGRPPQNAEKFAQWIKTKNFNPKSLYYSLIGCGNSQWSTFQQFPREIDQAFAEGGAIRISSRGEADADLDLEGSLEAWRKRLFVDLSTVLEIPLDLDQQTRSNPRRFSVSLSQPSDLRPLYAEHEARPFKVIQNRELQRVGGDDGSERATRHIELLLPSGHTYQTGDHFGVFAKNREHLVYGVAQRLRLHLDTLVTIRKSDENYPTFLPINQSLTTRTLLTEYIELQDVASRETLERLIPLTMHDEEKNQLCLLSAETPEGLKLYQSEILQKRRSLFDVLCLFPHITLPLEIFLEMVAPLRPRYYSISSSSYATPERLSITMGVVSGPALSQNGTFKGVCSHYLQTRELGDYVYGFIKSSSETFRLPSQPEIPIIMVGPGTGVAPFRGFLAERAALIRHKDQLESPGNPLRLGPALLFFGCRHSKHDFIYQRELEGYVSQQIVDLFVAFSHEDGSPYRFVQDHIKAQGKRVMDLMDQGAHVYICGDGVAMAPDVKRTFLELYQERYQCDSIVAEQWLTRLEASGRYCLDVFGQKGT